MSEMERTKAIRFRGTKEKILSLFPDFSGDFYELDEYLCKIQNIESWNTNHGQFRARCGSWYNGDDWNTEYYLDHIIDYEWDSPSSEFKRTRSLSDYERNKYFDLFYRFTNYRFDEPFGLRLVEYCYYNGCDAPAVYDQVDEFYEEV